ncbi:hypothetical protein BX600DRAFT_522550 [Xylariales sp. PMI_506]|nr:hypothetical protein BX600DRAFT_522550 [Xylariales sp. PMI_506]
MSQYVQEYNDVTHPLALGKNMGDFHQHEDLSGGQSPPVINSGGNSHGHIRHRPRRPVLRIWTLELLSVVFAIAILVAVFAVLAHFNGQQIPQWPLSINLNTIVSILSIMFRTAILFVIVEVFGQLRWSLFRYPRPLADLQYVERAGNSALSAAHLLLRAPKSILIISSSLITIAAIAVGPFMQQSIKTFACEQQVPGVNSSISVGNYVSTTAPRVGAGMFDLQGTMKATMINGLANPQGNDSAVFVSCPSGNCTFPEYAGITHSTIGMCGMCFDTSSKIPVVNGSVYLTSDGNVTLPSGLSVSNRFVISSDTIGTLTVGGTGTGGLDGLSWATDIMTEEFAAVASRSLFNFTVLTFTSASCDESPDFDACSSSFRNDLNGYLGVDFRPLAVSCTIYSCLKNFRGSVMGGELQEIEVSTELASPIIEAENGEINYLAGVNVGNYTAVKEPCFVDGQLYDSSNFSLVDTTRHEFDLIKMDTVGDGTLTNVSVPLECLYKLRGTYGAGLTQYMQNSLFKGACAGNADSSGVIHCANNFWLEPFWNNASADALSVSAVVSNFTTVVTNRLRDNGHSLYVTSDRSRYLESAVQGAVYSTTVCTQFDWRWLLLPVVLVALTVALVLATITTSYVWQDQPVWKSSSLPLIYYGFTDGVTPSDKLDKKELEEFAEQTRVKLRVDQVVGFQCVNS